MIVMIVDDSQFMRNVVKRCFDELKIPSIIVEAPDGKEALNKLHEMRPDLILLDWNMPNLSGIEFLKQVREKEEYKELPIIMVTSEGSRLNVIEAFKNGATDYVLKPMTAAVLKGKIIDIFGDF
jgi:two-component system chemotaxis response regulator CheY